MNYRDNGYVVEHLYNMAKEKSLNHILVDILNKNIHPKTFEIPVIKESLDHLLTDFERLLSLENIPIDVIYSAKASIEFDLQNPHISAAGAELEKYFCFVEIIDQGYKSHKITVKEWWR